jgi:CubicO group peptidase (beta-lactamase class C family)
MHLSVSARRWGLRAAQRAESRRGFWSIGFVASVILAHNGALQAGAQAITPRQLDSIAAAAFRVDGPGGVVLVARHGTPILRRAYGMAHLELGVPMATDHVFLTGSITKEFTAIAILQLAASGRLALSDDVRTHVPEVNTHGKRITIEHVLTHTSGLANLVDLASFDSLARHDLSAEQLVALTRDEPLHFEPGTGFYYSDTGYILLGLLIERVTGIPYGRYVEERIFRPLGMNDSYYADDARIIPRRVPGYDMRDGQVVNTSFISMTIPHAAGALASTVDDILRWHLALRSDSVVPPALLKTGWQPRTLPSGVVSGYGFGFKLCSLQGHRTVEHGGFVNGFTANALQLPDDSVDVIVFGNNSSDAPDAGVVARKLARAVLTGSPDAPRPPLSQAARQALVGTYRIAPDHTRRVFEREGDIYIQRDGFDAVRYVALSDTELTPAVDDGAYVLRFEIGRDGKASSVRASLRCEPGYVGTRVK